MTIADMRRAAEDALGQIPFAPPLSFDYCTAVQHAIQSWIMLIQAEIVSESVDSSPITCGL